MPRPLKPQKPANDNFRPIKAGMSLPDAIGALQRLIKEKPPHSVVLEINADLAEFILTTYNTSNRPMKPAKIREYAEDLRAGRWGVTGDTLKFGADGSLKDGQNRLAAIIRAGGHPMITHAVFGIEPTLFTRMDIGKNRTPSDIFNIAGVRYSNHTAAAVRWLLILTSSNPKNRAAHFKNEDLLEAYKDRFEPLDLEDSVRLAMDVKKQTGAPVGSVAALHYLLQQKYGEAANQFFLEWAEGGEEGSPTRVLQGRLQDLMLETNNRIHETVRNALIVEAFHAWVENKKIEKKDLTFNPAEDKFPPLAA